MAQKTSSSTVAVGGWIFIFFNRPDNNDIEYIRFQSPKVAKKGSIGTSMGSIVANEGAIDVLVVPGNGDGKDLVLYYISPDLVVKEIRLRDAHKDTVNMESGWIAEAPDMTFEKSVDGAVRSVDASTFMSASTRGGNPVVSFAAKGQAGKIRYCFYSDDMGAWLNTLLQI